MTCRFILHLGLLLVAGCAGPSAIYAPTATQQPHQHVAFEHVLMTYRKPQRPYILVGQIETRMFNGRDESLKALRDKAAEVGLDGVCDIECAAGGLVDAGNCAGLGFLWEKQ